jgi:hypothetical protein
VRRFFAFSNPHSQPAQANVERPGFRPKTAKQVAQLRHSEK